MIITTEISNADGFEFWCGGRDTVEELTTTQLDAVWDILENDIFCEGATDTEINDFFWFERDTIAGWLGFEDFSELMRNNKE